MRQKAGAILAVLALGLAMLSKESAVPLVGVLAVTRLGVISARQLAKNRGYVILLLAIVAAVATPTPDPVTMLLAMAPLVVLFEFSVLLARIFERRRRQDEEEAEDDDDRPYLAGGWDSADDDVTVS